jgi:hypothetical protein
MSLASVFDHEARSFEDARSSPVARITPTVDLVPGELQICIQQMLAALGEDPQREGLQDTPRRLAKALLFWTSGYKQDPAAVLKTFADGGEHYDTMVFQGEGLGTGCLDVAGQRELKCCTTSCIRAGP